MPMSNAATLDGASKKDGSHSSREDVLATLRNHADDIRGFGATALYLFGSAARDEMRADSDIDMFIDYEAGGPFSLFDLMHLEEYLGHLMGRKVDLLTRNGLHRRLKDQIEKSSIKAF